MARRPPKSPPPDPDDVHRAMLEHLAQNPPPRPRRKATPAKARARKATPPPPSATSPAPTRKTPSRPRVMLRMLRLEDALAKLDTVVRYHCARGTAEIVVVVGRGKRSAGGPVIGPAVRRWCDAHAGLVRDWRVADPPDGGEGALVLRLVCKR